MEGLGLVLAQPWVLSSRRAGNGQAQQVLPSHATGSPCQDLPSSPATGLTCILPGDSSVSLPVERLFGQRDVLL